MPFYSKEVSVCRCASYLGYHLILTFLVIPPCKVAFLFTSFNFSKHSSPLGLKADLQKRGKQNNDV